MATTDIADAAKPIRDKWEEIKNEFFKRNPGRYLILTSVHRPVEEQFTLYKKGRTMDTQGHWVVEHQEQVVTNVDGYKVLGAHNYFPSRAIDVAVVDNQTGKTLWEESNYYCLLEIAKGVGLESGGQWESSTKKPGLTKDWPHIQIPNYKEYKNEL